MPTHVHMCICAHACTCMYTYMHTHAHTRAYTHALTHTHAHTQHTIRVVAGWYALTILSVFLSLVALCVRPPAGPTSGKRLRHCQRWHERGVWRRHKHHQGSSDVLRKCGPHGSLCEPNMQAAHWEVSNSPPGPPCTDFSVWIIFIKIIPWKSFWDFINIYIFI